ncbi:hypothetical protein [Rheinheimera hassiensis]|uniref:hypothetical protein n=1 Tax=Rheinheimera hassiensis TaxID=1193627 RepID=UPI001F061FFF|nr:hypothetical protein [Rheinheimera hassiensis]
MSKARQLPQPPGPRTPPDTSTGKVVFDGMRQALVIVLVVSQLVLLIYLAGKHFGI